MITTIKKYFSSNSEFNASCYAEKAEKRFARAASSLKLLNIYTMMYRVEAMVKLAYAYVSLKFHQSNAYLVAKVSQTFSSSQKAVEDISNDKAIAGLGGDYDEAIKRRLSANTVKAEKLAANKPVSRVYQVAVIANIAALGYALTR